MQINSQWFENQLAAIKAANPDGITEDNANAAAVRILNDAAEAVAEAEQAERVAAARAEMAAALGKLQGFRAGRSNVPPVDIAALTNRRLAFRDSSRVAIDKDLEPTRNAINIGMGVLAAAVPMIASGGITSPASVSALVAPLSGVIMDFVNN